jgi:predicted small lipoprotein YifL
MLQRKISVAARPKAALTVWAWLIVAALASACGQKGPLKLAPPADPASNLAKTTALPASSPASSP